MERFEFKDSVKVDVAGVIVSLKTSGTTLEKAIKFGEDIQKKAKGLDKLDYKKAIGVVCTECDEFIDTITEEGAAKKIFADRVIDPMDRMQVVEYLVNQIKNHRVGSVNIMEQKYNPNRAQRRNNKKK